MSPTKHTVISNSFKKYNPYLVDNMNKLGKNIKFLCDDLFEGRRDSVLIYGTQPDATTVLKGVYNSAKNKSGFLCSWHNADKIKKTMDFFKPILRLKYGAKYAALEQKKWFKELAAQQDNNDVFQIASLCAQEPKSNDAQKRKLPLIFIDGIEKLLFKIDYGNLAAQSVKKLLTANFFEQPLPNGFGNCLRGYLHQTSKGVFYCAVHDYNSTEYNATLGNYSYLFYSENFRTHEIIK